MKDRKLVGNRSHFDLYIITFLPIMHIMYWSKRSTMTSALDITDFDQWLLKKKAMEWATSELDVMIIK